MRFPKLWDGANAVGEAKARHLDTIDVPFLRASGPGFSSHKRGEFAEVFGVVTTDEKVEDGWLTFSDGFYTSGDITIRGASSSRRKFISRGTFADSESNGAISNSGRGWGFVRELIQYDIPTPGFRTIRYSKSRTGRPGSELWVDSELYAVNELLHGYTGNFYTFYDGQPVFFSSDAIGFVDTDSVVRQKPRIRLWSQDINGAWGMYRYPDPISFAGKNHTFADTTPLEQGVMLIAFAEFGDDKPTLYATGDYGAHWAALPALPNILPGMGTWTFDDRATIASAHPGYTPKQVEDAFLAQNSVQQLAVATHIELWPIAADRVLINASYRKQGTNEIMAAVSLVDPYTGALKWQHQMTPAAPNTILIPQLEVSPTGFGSWIVAESDATQTYRNPIGKLVTYFGSTETAISFPADAVAVSVAPIHNKRPAGPTNLTPPDFYFVVWEREGGVPYRKRLYVTTDHFTTSKQRGVLGPAGPGNKHDYNRVIWLGTPSKPSPINPTFPWLMDTRFQTPNWWINVAAYGG